MSCLRAAAPAVVLLLVASLAGVVDARAPAAATAAAPAAARSPIAIETDRPCGKIAAQGCCEGSLLWWCDRSGRLRGLDCRQRSRCGWHDRGQYDCNTAGNPDPTGVHSKHCDFGAAGPPRPPPLDSDCGAITTSGCCDGQLLRYCEGGRLKVIDCSRNPSCGWRGVGQIYNCGTEGEADPGGRHPQACPASAAASVSSPPAAHFTGTAPPATASSARRTTGAGARRPATAAEGKRGAGCSLIGPLVADGAQPAAASRRWLPLWLLLLVATATHRRVRLDGGARLLTRSRAAAADRAEPTRCRRHRRA